MSYEVEYYNGDGIPWGEIVGAVGGVFSSGIDSSSTKKQIELERQRLAIEQSITENEQEAKSQRYKMAITGSLIGITIITLATIFFIKKRKKK